MAAMSAVRPSFLVCLVTHPAQGAERFARALVERGIAACVNRASVASTYRWQGRVEESGEELLIVKTTREQLGALERMLASDHPYDVPELIALTPAAVGGPYADWWSGAVGAQPAG